MASSPYIALPAELRVWIYDNLFKGLIYPVDDCDGHAQAEIYRAEFDIKTAILHTSHATRNEALPVLERHITIMALYAGDLSKTPQHFRKATSLRLEEVFLHPVEVLMHLPKLKSVQCSRDTRSCGFYMQSSNPYRVRETLQGGDDKYFLRDIRLHCNRGVDGVQREDDGSPIVDTVKWVKDLPFDLLIRSTHTVKMDLGYSLSGSILWHYCISVNIRDWTIQERHINMRAETLEEENSWKSASEIAFLYAWTRWPILLHEPSGQRASILDVHNHDIDTNELKRFVDADMDVDGPNYKHSFEGRCQFGNPSDEDLEIEQPAVWQQWDDKIVLSN